MFCSVLQCVAVCCSVLQCVAVCQVAMPEVLQWQYVVACCSVLRCVAVCGSVRVSSRDARSVAVAVCCNVLQCVAVCRSAQCLPAATPSNPRPIRDAQNVAVCYSMLRCVAVCCSVLQCGAVCCSVSQCVAMSTCSDTFKSPTNSRCPKFAPQIVTKDLAPAPCNGNRAGSSRAIIGAS